MSSSSALTGESRDKLHAKMHTGHTEYKTADVIMTDGTEDASDVRESSATQMNGAEHAQDYKPHRRFAPEPLETTSRSSRSERNLDDKTTSLPKRKFAPEPIETTTRSSKAKEEAKPRRKFDAEPIEIIYSSNKSREKNADDLENGARPRRRFAVEPVETNTRSSEDLPTKPRRKFAVEPVETTTTSSRARQHQDSGNSDDKSEGSQSRSSTGGRRFSPVLLGTAKASFRKKPDVKSAVPQWLRNEVEDDNSWTAPEIPESRFSSANLAKKARADPRRHSYSVPDLPMIQSDSSEEEIIDPPTPGVMSTFNSRDRNIPRLAKHSHQHQKHLDDLKTLREQAVAAYGHQEDHVQFGHYGGDSEDEDYAMSVGQLSIEDDADPSLFRRMSHHDLHLVMEDMRQHHAQLEDAKRGLREDTAGISRFSAAALAARHHMNTHHPVGSSYRSRYEAQKAGEEDREFAKIRKAASPPMQGDNIKFPYSISPKMTRCNPDQVPRPRRANSEEEEEHDIGVVGMWSAHIVPAQKDAAAGLWGGLCQKDTSTPKQTLTGLRSGLQTPAFEHSNPFESRTPGKGTKTPRRGLQPWNSCAWLALTPPTSKQEKTYDDFATVLDKKLSLEQQIDEEFPPRVITQIYNYLSLGYPPLARPFDEELSKISRISLVELRKGDRSQTGTMKGHVGVPEGEGDAEEDDDGRVRGCKRWDALRLYVREWARQSPNFADPAALSNIGTGMWGNNAPVRKGSWGF